MLDIVTLKSMCKEYKDASDRVDHSLHSLKLELESMRRQDVYLLQKLMAVGEKIGQIQRKGQHFKLNETHEDRRRSNAEFRPHVELRFRLTRKFGSKSEYRDKLRSKHGEERQTFRSDDNSNNDDDENTDKGDITQNNDYSHDAGVVGNFKAMTWTQLNNVTNLVNGQTSLRVSEDEGYSNNYSDSISETNLQPWKTCRDEIRHPGDSRVELNTAASDFENEVFISSDERHVGITPNNDNAHYGKDISACYKDTVFAKKLGSGGDETRYVCKEKMTMGAVQKTVLRVTYSDPSVVRDLRGSVDSVNTVESLADSVYGSLSDIDDDQTNTPAPSSNLKPSSTPTAAIPSSVLSTLFSSSFHSRPAKLNKKVTVALTPDSNDGQILVSSTTNGCPAKYEEILKRNARVWRWSLSSPHSYRINRLLTHGRVVEW